MQHSLWLAVYYAFAVLNAPVISVTFLEDSLPLIGVESQRPTLCRESSSAAEVFTKFSTRCGVGGGGDGGVFFYIHQMS